MGYKKSRVELLIKLRSCCPLSKKILYARFGVATKKLWPIKREGVGGRKI